MGNISACTLDDTATGVPGVPLSSVAAVEAETRRRNNGVGAADEGDGVRLGRVELMELKMSALRKRGVLQKSTCLSLHIVN
eukprot:SAG11_NODE_12641_length_693_cov_1.021886_1_plen_80_part_10